VEIEENYGNYKEHTVKKNKGRLKKSGNRRELVGITTSTLLKKSGRIEGERNRKELRELQRAHC
jgi:hypothetical protein